MAQKSRSALKTDVGGTLPSGTGDIQAVNHRGLEDNILDSHFNLITDYSGAIRYASEGSQTVEQKIQALENQIANITSAGQIMLIGRTSVFNANDISVGQTLNSTPGITVTVSGKSGRDFLLTISHPNAGSGTQVPILTWVIQSTDWNANNDIFLTARSLTSSSFQISGRNIDDNPTGYIAYARIRAL